MKRSTASLVLAASIAASAVTPGLAEPTEAQKEAIRSNCVADFESYCKGVTPGGAPAFECLDKNVDNLSEACQAAVKAVATEVDSSASSTGN